MNFDLCTGMIDSVTTSRKVCDAVTKKGCDDDESAYLDKWRGDAAARDANAGVEIKFWAPHQR